MKAIYLNDVGLICNLGQGKHVICEALLAGDTRGMRLDERYAPSTALTLGCVDADLPAVPNDRAVLDCRNNRLTLAALEQIKLGVTACIERYGAHRIGVVMGTSTSGISDGEQALIAYAQQGVFPSTYHYRQQELGSCSDFVATFLGLSGPCYTLSTACSSGANALASAHRMLQLDLCDAVIAGGSDSLCKMTVQGFSSLEAVSAERCNPFSVHRKGTNLGEAAALFLISREPGPVTLLGCGAGSDAHHISAPAPDGRGALAAMRGALHQAGLTPDAVDYINLHGTATVQNDMMESHAVAELFSDLPSVSSTKALTGHTLGAAGALEAAFCWLVLSEYNQVGQLPPHIWDGCADPALPELPWTQHGETSSARPKVCLSNSFAFGGSNAAVLLGRNDDD